jgi:putative intracellular protease/amidase
MGKILCYIYQEMADFEISLLLHRLKNKGEKEIVSVSDDLSLITAQSGLTFKPDKSIDEITDVSDIEALIIPGGPINNEQNEICPLVRQMVDHGKLVAAVCFGPQFLARSGILEKYHYTTSCSPEKIVQLKLEDPFNRTNFVMSRTVVDKNVITAQGYAFVDFALEVCRYLGTFETDLQEYEQFGRIKDS